MMKKILFVEDQPDLKLNMLIYCLNSKGIHFEYEVVGSITEAKRYLRDKNNKVDWDTKLMAELWQPSVIKSHISPHPIHVFNEGILCAEQCARLKDRL